MDDLRNQIAVAKAQSKQMGNELAEIDIGRFVTQQAALFGDRIVLDVFEDGAQISYRALEAQTNKIGNALRAFGVEQGDRVACMLPNRIEYPLIWLALAKIGAVHVPVNTRYTAVEIAYVLRDANVKVAVADGAFCSQLKGALKQTDIIADQVIWLDVGHALSKNTYTELINDAPDTSCQDNSLRPTDMMNIQYTSGTTGLPKGCILSHDYWMVLAQSTALWDAEAPRRMLTAQPFFYMDPQWHLLKAMQIGATLFMAPNLSSTRFIGWVKKYAIEWCQFPVLMTQQPEQPDDDETALKQVATFGWSAKTCRDFQTRFGVMAREAFGMTEIGLGCWMPTTLETLYDSGSVGIAGPCREVSIRDENGAAVIYGETGELWVRGRGIFDGYWNNAKATAEAITKDGWFRTGDLFRCDDSGCYYLVGRIKDMIRRSQENISAHEVEAAINELDAVEDSAAIAVPDDMRGEEVKIIIQLKSGVCPDDLPPKTILAHASSKIAPFKRPRYIAYIDVLPRTPSNKVAKKSLIAGSTDLRIGAYDAIEKIWVK